MTHKKSKESVDPPAELDKVARSRWLAVVPELARRGPLDRDLVTTYCQVWARWRHAESSIAQVGSVIRNDKGRPVPNPYTVVSNQAANQVRSLEKRLGIGVGTATDDSDADNSTALGNSTAAELLLTRRELAARLHVHMQTISKWEQDGMPIAERGRRGRASRYQQSEIQRWLTHREQAAQKSGLFDVAQERARKERAQAALAEQSYQTRERELLPRSEVEKVWSAEIAAVRTKLLAIPIAFADRVHRASTLDGLVGVERALKDAVYDALRELANPDREPTPPPAPGTGEQMAA